LPRTDKKDFTETEEYRRFIEFAPVGMQEIKFDPPRFVWVNEETCRILGYTREELLKMNPLDFTDKAGKQLFLERVGRKFAKEKEDTQAEFKIKAKDGRELWASMKATLTREDGVVDGALVVAQDITGRKKAEADLRKSEGRYRSYIEVTGELGWTTNPEGEVKEDMPTWRNYTGQTFEEIKGSGWSKALHPDDLDNTLGVWRKAVKEKRKYEVEYRIRRHDGVYRHFMVRGVPVFNDEGTIREWVGTCIDITERKKAEEVLQEQSVAISSAPDAILSTNSSFVIKSWNKAAERIFGWKADEVVGKASTAIFKIVYPTLQGVTREIAFNELVRKGFWKGEVLYHKKDGSRIPVSASVSAVKDRKGNLAGTVAIIHDISTRKRREKILRKTQQDLKRAQAVAKTGNWRMDTRRNILSWSDESYRLFGVPKGTPMTYESFLEKVHPEDREFVDRKWKAALQGEPYDIEHRIVVDGEVKWVRERAELEFGKDGTLLGGFGTTQEITDLVEMRQKLEDASVQLEEYASSMEQLAEERAEKLREAERMATIGATAGMVGHDIRNPLQVIAGDLYLIASDVSSLPESEEKESMKESIAAIKKSVEYIDKIVQDLSDYAKRLQPDMQETDVAEVCQEVLFKNECPENIEVTVQVDKDAKTFIADPVLLKRILENLVNNAVQAMPNGGKLEVHAFRASDELVITVQDSGVGISEEAKPKLFTPLFTTKSKGQGFGLAAAKRITEALGGTVNFESEVGKGAKFVLRFPPPKKKVKWIFKD
jgi:PAS domain S-box-containing protein